MLFRSDQGLGVDVVALLEGQGQVAVYPRQRLVAEAGDRDAADAVVMRVSDDQVAVGRDRDAVGESVEWDPGLAAIRGPYTGTLNDYVRRELGFESDLPHEILTSRVRPWSYGDFQNRYVDVAETLRQVMTMNPTSRFSWPADTTISRRPVSRPGTHSTISVSSESSRTTSGSATTDRVT